MSKKILIVESDARLMREMREHLQGAGFAVEETTDAKGAIELIRRTRPDLVVLAVDLSAGQNGYILCGKLKKDDELKAIPIVIVGNADGFAAHRKLKTRADDYVAKPVDMGALKNAVGALIGFPEQARTDEVVEESLSLSELVDDDGGSQTAEFNPEEIQVQETVGGDPELDMLDAAFDDISADGKSPPQPPAEDLSLDGPAASEPEPEISALNDIREEPLDAFDDSEQATVVAIPAQVAQSRPAPRTGGPADGDSRELRAKVAQLEGALEDAQRKIDEQESRIRELENELAAKTAEAEAARSTGGARDKEFFALKDQVTKKDKEILRLKQELTEKEKELVDRQERENQLEQQVSESSSEMARRDAQIKTLQSKADQLQQERKKVDQQLAAAREESRAANARLKALEADFDAAQERLRSLEAELDELREKTGEVEQLREEANALRDQLESARRENDDLRSQLESAQMELDSAKSQLTTQATAFAEEAASLRKRIAEMEEASAKYEERVTKLYGRIKGDEKLREKTKKALSIAMQLLDEQVSLEDDVKEDEAAA